MVIDAKCRWSWIILNHHVFLSLEIRLALKNILTYVTIDLKMFPKFSIIIHASYIAIQIYITNLINKKTLIYDFK